MKTKYMVRLELVAEIPVEVYVEPNGPPTAGPLAAASVACAKAQEAVDGIVSQLESDPWLVPADEVSFLKTMKAVTAVGSWRAEI